MAYPLFRAVTLSLLLLASMLSVKWGDEGDDAGASPSCCLILVSQILVSLLIKSLSYSLLRWLISPHCQHTCCSVLLCSVAGNCVPVGALALTSVSLAGRQLPPLQPLASRLGWWFCWQTSGHPYGGAASHPSPTLPQQKCGMPPSGWSPQVTWQEPSGLLYSCCKFL
jgi:hypothetical protein